MSVHRDIQDVKTKYLQHLDLHHHKTPHASTMAQIAPRLFQRNICRQCATQARHLTTSTPKNEILSRPLTTRLSSAPLRQQRQTQWQRTAQPFSSSARRTYKTVEEAKGRYKVGVSIAQPTNTEDKRRRRKLD